MTVEETIISILNRICGAQEGEIEPELELFDEGLLDSFGFIALLVELEEAFDISLQIEELSREQISTPSKLAELVRDAL